MVVVAARSRLPGERSFDRHPPAPTGKGSIKNLLEKGKSGCRMFYLTSALILAKQEHTSSYISKYIDGEIGKKSKHVFLLTRLVSLQERPSLWAKTFNLPHTSPLPRHRTLEN
jgi:hypothetical protein